MSWQKKLSELLPSLGHRNWIIVADAAYPLQTSSGLVTLITEDSISDCLSVVIEQLKIAPHVRPIALLDKELSFLTNEQAPGVEPLRLKIIQALEGTETEVKLHDQILPSIAEASQTYTVVVIKTPTTIPYTSVFLRLECGYWNAASENALRQQMS